jgi:PAS domain-containing protein
MPINLVILFVLVLVAVGVFAYYFFSVSAVKENYELEQFKALFEFATEGIIIANKEGRIVLANPKALQQFGYTAHELANKEIEVLIPQQSKHKHVQDREAFTKKPSHRAMGGSARFICFEKRRNCFSG